MAKNKSIHQMSSILYYSNYCENCRKVIASVSQSKVKDDMHFICIDNRHKKANGSVYIKLQNGEEVILPPSVTKVPALLLINRGYHVLFGEEIMNHIQPNVVAMKQQAVAKTGEPSAFSLGGGGYGVSSDFYSFLDQSSDELSAKGTGGMRQTHHYAGVSHQDQIETPPDTYNADTIGEVSINKLQNQRENDIKINKK